jgi:alkyl hydroperoxide reductase subunit AhpC
MVTVGKKAPAFDCSAVVDDEVVELNWNQVHERRTLVLQFDSIENYADLPDDLVALSNSIGDFERLQANVAVVCRDHVFEILEWANRSAGEGGPGEIAFPIIVDSDDRIASMYDMLNVDGCSHWGHIIIDPVGRVRQIAMSVFHIGPNIDELIRCVTTISNEQSEFG